MPVKTPPKKQPNSSKQAKATEEELRTKPDITRVVRSSEGLPDGWRWVKLGDVCERITKGGTPTTYGYKFQRNGVRFLKIENVKEGRVLLDSISDFISEEAHEFQKKSQLSVGDILFSIAGTIGETCAVREEYLPANTNQAFAIIRGAQSHFDLKFLQFQLESFVARIKVKARGGAMNNVSLEDIKNFEAILPPMELQHAIVSKIEELLSELDKGKQQLETAQQQLKIYRQAVLKWAFEGKLTIRDVKEGELPIGWRWVTMNDVCNKIGDIDHKMPKQLASGYPYVSTKDFTDDLKISFENAKYISKDDFINLSRKIKPERGDIIFPRYGTIGKNILIDFDKEFLVSYSCAVVKPNHSLVLSKYVYLYSLSPKITDEIRKYVVETTQANIGIASIKSFVFPLPSKEQQDLVVQEIESRLSVCDKVEETITTSLQKAETLRQSILKKAFEGKLV